MNVEKRIEIEKRIVRHLCDTMRKHGWIAVYVDDGGDEVETTTSTEQVVEAVFAVDEATIAFRKGGANRKTGMTCFVQIVLGNDGWDCISDYSYTDEFEKIMTEEVDPFSESLEGEC